MVRPATLKDAAAISRLIYQAMGDLANQFRATENQDQAIALLQYFIALEGNQYSYLHTLVYEVDGEVIGSVNAYDGADIEALRQPFFAYLQANYHPKGFEMEVESGPGEFYIDTLSVNPEHQGKGIGKQLILSVIERAKKLGHQRVGLLVNDENNAAKNLYLRLGFEQQGKKNLLGSSHAHLIKSI